MKKKPIHRESSGSDDFAVGGRHLASLVKRLLAQGNIRRLVILRPSGRVLFETSLTSGVAVAGVFVIMAPMLTALGALAALLAEIRVRVYYSGNVRRD